MGKMLEESSFHNPNGISILSGDTKITYAQLHNYVEKFAAGLKELGIKKGDCVALYLSNTPQFVISYFGILKLGAIVTACSPLYKERELDYQLNDSQARAIVCHTSNYHIVKNILNDSMLEYVILADPQDLEPIPTDLKDADRTQVETDSVLKFRNLIHTHTPTLSKVNIDASHDLALLQYTGGTTGTPKGAMITHRNLVVNAVQFSTWLRFRHDDIHLTVLPLFHIYGMTTSMNAPIYSASSMILVPRFDSNQLLKTIDKYRPTVFCGVPTMYTALVNHPEVGKHDLRSIRACISGAAPLPGEIQRKFEQITKGRLVEGYGLSETSQVTHVNPIDEPRKNRIGSIGIPVFDTEAKIVDINTGEKDVAPGESGELVVHGPQVMSGYWRKPEETRNSLRDGWFYTGDIAKMDDDGYFYIIDRKKDMINVSGLKVYPREVEELLYEHPEVKEVCVVGVPDPYRGERVKAFVVLKEGSSEKTISNELIDFCRERIAGYKVPSEIEFLSEMPKTAAGKIMRRALRKSASSSNGSAQEPALAHTVSDENPS